MASGNLGQVAPAATTLTTVYTVPASNLAVVNINIANRSTSATVDVRVAISTLTTPNTQDYIEFDSIIAARGVLERTAIPMEAGRKVVVYTSTANTSVNVYGLEQTV